MRGTETHQVKLSIRETETHQVKLSMRETETHQVIQVSSSHNLCTRVAFG